MGTNVVQRKVFASFGQPYLSKCTATDITPFLPGEYLILYSTYVENPIFPQIRQWPVTLAIVPSLAVNNFCPRGQEHRGFGKVPFSEGFHVD